MLLSNSIKKNILCIKFNVDTNSQNYPKIIENPMCLDDIRNKLRKDEYETFKQCIQNFQLMFAKCYKFNSVCFLVNKI